MTETIWLHPNAMRTIFRGSTNAGRMHAGGSAGGAARRPAPAKSVVDLGPTCRLYTAKPYASWPGWYVNYGQNVRYSISSITNYTNVSITGLQNDRQKLRTNRDDY